jgi:hypothetical protein
MKRILLTNPEMGVYLGHCLGLGLWSKLDPAGQLSACVFETEAEAREHVSSWKEPHNDPDQYRYVELETENDMYATMEECMEAHQEPWQMGTNCRCGATESVQWRRLCTQYSQECRNWLWGCEPCFKEEEQHYQDLWLDVRGH